jgi:hypothetical protein
MGLDRAVIFPGRPPTWPALKSVLTAEGVAVQMRMIDGQLAFPDEEPAEDWRELRLAGPGGMVTLRREADRLSLVIWGNADAALLRFWNTLAWACAAAGGGQVQTPEGLLDAEAFRQSDKSA